MWESSSDSLICSHVQRLQSSALSFSHLHSQTWHLPSHKTQKRSFSWDFIQSDLQYTSHEDNPPGATLAECLGNLFKKLAQNLRIWPYRYLSVCLPLSRYTVYISADSHPKFQEYPQSSGAAVNSYKYTGKNEISSWANRFVPCINKHFTSLSQPTFSLSLSLSESKHIYRAHPCFNKTNGIHRTSEQPYLLFLNWKYETIDGFVASLVLHLMPQGSHDQIISLHKLFIALHMFQSQISRHSSSAKNVGLLIFFLELSNHNLTTSKREHLWKEREYWRQRCAFHWLRA